MKKVLFVTLLATLTINACIKSPTPTATPTATIIPSPIPPTETPVPTLTPWEETAPEEIASMQEDGTFIFGLDAVGEIRYLWDAAQETWLKLPADLPAGAYLAEDGLALLDADGEELYVLEQGVDSQSSWVEAMMPLGEMSAEMQNMWNEAEEYYADEIASGEVRITRGEETNRRGVWEYVEKVGEEPTEEEIRSVPSFVKKSENGLSVRLYVRGVLSGDWKLMKLVEDGGFGDFEVDDIMINSSIWFVNTNDYDGDKRDGGIRKVDYVFMYYINFFNLRSRNSDVVELRKNSPGLPSVEALENFFRSGCLGDGNPDTVDYLKVGGVGISEADVDLYDLDQEDLDKIDVMQNGFVSLEKSHPVE